MCKVSQPASIIAYIQTHTYLTSESMVQPQYQFTSTAQTIGLFQYYNHLRKLGLKEYILNLCGYHSTPAIIFRFLQNSTIIKLERNDLPTNPSSPTSFKAILSANTEELPWAMLAKGPACTNTGVPYRNRKTN